MKRTNWILWILTILFTFSIAIYQRMTGPTKPVRGKVEIGNTTVKFKLLRTEISGINAEVKIFTGDTAISGNVKYKRYKSNDEWVNQEMYYKDGFLTALLPTQPEAGKVMYEVVLRSAAKEYPLTEEPVIIRYKGDVPPSFLIPHIIFMFIGLLMSVRCLFQSLFVKKPINIYTTITLFSLVLGGFIFGPFVQKYAFGAYWTGFPFGHDLTDNKTAIAIVFWFIAFIMSVRNSKNTRWWVLAAAIVLLATYLVPHSMFGSEIDYAAIEQAGKV